MKMTSNYKATIATFFTILLSMLVGNEAHTQQMPERKMGWKLGVQSFTFKEFTFLEAIEKADSCGLKYIEGYPSMVLGGEIEGKLDFRMDANKRVEILSWLKKRGMRLTGYGVIRITEEEEWRKLFDFGKAMGIETFTAEPDEKVIPLLSKLCEEYQINIAIHNHAKPTHYWNPDVILSAIKGQSNRIGACADVGHWLRSSLDPVECLKKLKGHVLWVHMKDMNDNTPNSHSVVWGTGVLNIPSVIKELKKQNFKGQLSVEYEYNWKNNAQDVAASVNYFRSLLNKY